MADDGPDQEILFNIGGAFPADDEVARYVASLSMALNDMRVAAEFAVRGEQPYHERLYFVRLLASHMREALKLVALIPDERDPIGAFVAELPASGSEARADVVRRIEDELQHRGETLFSEMKRIRDDTFHYARDEPSQKRLTTAMELAAHEDGRYLISENWLRAEYADVIATRLVHSFSGDEEQLRKFGHELHRAIVDLVGPLSKFILIAERHYLRSMPPGTIAWP